MFTQQEDSTACRTQASLSDPHLCQSGSWRQNPDWRTPKTWQPHVGQRALSSIRCRTQQKVKNSYSGAFQIQVSCGGGSDTQHFIPSHFNEKPLKIPHHLQLDRCWHFSTSACVIDSKITSAPSVIRLHYTVTRWNPSPLFSFSKKYGIWKHFAISHLFFCRSWCAVTLVPTTRAKRRSLYRWAAGERAASVRGAHLATFCCRVKWREGWKHFRLINFRIKNYR